MRDDGGRVFLICRCLREKQTILFHLYSAIPLELVFGEEGGEISHQRCLRGRGQTSWNQTACWRVYLQMEIYKQSLGCWLANRRPAGAGLHLPWSAPNSQTGSLTPQH